MRVIVPINGKNERMGELFKTPKHLLLYNGKQIISHICNYFGEVTILTNDDYIKEIGNLFYASSIEIINIGKTNSQIETLLRYTEKIVDNNIMFVDCDIIPLTINSPLGNTVYCFENKLQYKQYSNYSAENGHITACNEKESVCKYAGAGVYYFESSDQFNKYAIGEKSISGVVKKMIQDGIKFKLDCSNEILRFGTLKDIIL